MILLGYHKHSIILAVSAFTFFFFFDLKRVLSKVSIDFSCLFLFSIKKQINGRKIFDEFDKDSFVKNFAWIILFMEVFILPSVYCLTF